MDDLIRRQAAIDALMAWEEGSVWDEECLKHRGEPYWVAPSDVIEQLPSAQPEQQWIPCSERLPEENTPVLLGVKFEHDFKYFVTARTDYNYWYGLGRDIRGEMRWRRLPDPWRGEEHG